MKRRKTERDELIIRKLKKGEFGVDIAKEFNITPAMVSKIKKRSGIIFNKRKEN